MLSDSYLYSERGNEEAIVEVGPSAESYACFPESIACPTKLVHLNLLQVVIFNLSIVLLKIFLKKRNHKTVLRNLSGEIEFS